MSDETKSADPITILKERGIGVPDNFPVEVAREFAKMVTTVWLEGQTIPLEKFAIDPGDEGLLFGRGVWETTRTIDGSPWLWPLHTDRMLQTAKLLFIDLAPERLPNAETVKTFVQSLGTQDAVIRLNATAGRPGKRGVVWMTAAPLAHHSPTLRLRGCRNPVQKGQALLTLKTFQYATRLRIGQLAAQTGFDTALLTDEAENVQEASHGNIFFKFADGWVTPKSDGGFLPGTVRHFLLEKSPIPIREEVIPFKKIGEAKEVFVTNSAVGIVPVTLIDDKKFTQGPDTTTLMRWLEPPRKASGVQYRFVNKGLVPR
jgi:branched-subunit amino acid aminotransferase/4-amino-4-deoxychorismate lyase